MLTDCENDASARGPDLACKLHAGRRGSDDHHAAIRQFFRLAVLHRREAGDLRRQARRDSRDSRDVTGAACKDERPTPPRTLVGCDLVAAVHLAHARDLCARVDRGARGAGISLQIADDLGHAHVAVRIVAVVGVSGKAALPVRREEAKRVPPLRLPGVGDLAPLEQHMVDRAVGEVLAHGKSGLAGADDDGRYVPHDTLLASPLAVS